MRFRITFRVADAGEVFIPASYQYELSSWIYKSIAEGNKMYANWLHSNGFVLRHKHFKLFCFSHLYIPRFTLGNGRLGILSSEVSFILSFLSEQATEEFVKGVFKDATCWLGDKLSQAGLTVKSIEHLPSPIFEREMRFQTLSPVVVSLQRADNSVEYLLPDDSRMAVCVFNNLKQKYEAFYNKPFDSKGIVEKFELTSSVKPKLITIKTNTLYETKVKAYQYSFSMQAHPYLQQIAYEAGIGEKNSMGFGCIGLDTRR